MDIWREEKEDLEWGYKEKTKVVFKARSKSSWMGSGGRIRMAAGNELPHPIPILCRFSFSILISITFSFPFL